MSLFTDYEFIKCVKRYKGDRHAIKFNCRDQFLVMSFAQFTNRSGLRDIETTLDLCSQDLYRSGLNLNLHWLKRTRKRIGVSIRILAMS